MRAIERKPESRSSWPAWSGHPPCLANAGLRARGQATGERSRAPDPDVAIPPMPSPHPRRRWTVEAQRAWQAWWSSPMAGQWIEADTVAIRRALRLVDDAARGKPGSHAALTALEDRLGLTPKRGAICDGKRGRSRCRRRSSRWRRAPTIRAWRSSASAFAICVCHAGGRSLPRQACPGRPCRDRTSQRAAHDGHAVPAGAPTYGRPRGPFGSDEATERRLALRPRVRVAWTCPPSVERRTLLHARMPRAGRSRCVIGHFRFRCRFCAGANPRAECPRHAGAVGSSAHGRGRTGTA